MGEFSEQPPHNDKLQRILTPEEINKRKSELLNEFKGYFSRTDRNKVWKISGGGFSDPHELFTTHDRQYTLYYNPMWNEFLTLRRTTYEGDSAAIKETIVIDESGIEFSRAKESPGRMSEKIIEAKNTDSAIQMVREAFSKLPQNAF